jgi:4-hydroxy-3-methylbut-2-enyl diphosphate reductase
VLVVGSQTSANSKRLALIAEETGTPAYLIDNANDIDDNWLNDVENVGITAGASTPDTLVQEAVKRIKDFATAKGIEEVNIYNGKDEEETTNQNS